MPGRPCCCDAETSHSTCSALLADSAFTTRLAEVVINGVEVNIDTIHISISGVGELDNCYDTFEDTYILSNEALQFGSLCGSDVWSEDYEYGYDFDSEITCDNGTDFAGVNRIQAAFVCASNTMFYDVWFWGDLGTGGNGCFQGYSGSRALPLTPSEVFESITLEHTADSNDTVELVFL